MAEIFFEALSDSSRMIPLLLIIYIGIELVEYRFGNQLKEKVQKIGRAGPLIGSLVGSFPQCGFSVTATALYTQRLITIGTLLAVYLATSDEAIPVILAQPERARILLPLILTKVVIALLAGYGLDIIFRRRNAAVLSHIKNYDAGHDDQTHHHEGVSEIKACCGHQPNSTARNFLWREIFIHPLVHTAKIFIFIFFTSFLLGLIFYYLGEETLTRVFLAHRLWQPFAAALIGLIPNCAASVAITELYLKGVITFGAVISGLSASGGLGLLLLFKEEKNKREVFLILSLLLGISILAGLLIQVIF